MLTFFSSIYLVCVSLHTITSHSSNSPLVTYVSAFGCVFGRTLPTVLRPISTSSARLRSLFASWFAQRRGPRAKEERNENNEKRGDESQENMRTEKYQMKMKWILFTNQDQEKTEKHQKSMKTTFKRKGTKSSKGTEKELRREKQELLEKSGPLPRPHCLLPR